MLSETFASAATPTCKNVTRAVDLEGGGETLAATLILHVRFSYMQYTFPVPYHGSLSKKRRRKVFLACPDPLGWSRLVAATIHTIQEL